jgi:hypothetical protein
MYTPLQVEVGWLHREGFQEMAIKVCERPIAGDNPFFRWKTRNEPDFELMEQPAG